MLFVELGLPVVKRLKTGPSTDQDVLEKLAEEHPLPRLVLEHRSLSKLKGTYVDALPMLVDPSTGASTPPSTRPGRPPGGSRPRTRTCRTSRSAPSSSRRIRAAFVAPAGRGCSSPPTTPRSSCASWPTTPRTRSLLDAFQRREDVHTRTAAETFGVPAGEVTPDQRRVAKVLNFGIAYGLSAFGLSQRLDMPPAEAQAIIDRYFARYAGVKRWLDATVAEATGDRARCGRSGDGAASFPTSGPATPASARQRSGWR